MLMERRGRGRDKGDSWISSRINPRSYLRQRSSGVPQRFRSPRGRSTVRWLPKDRQPRGPVEMRNFSHVSGGRRRSPSNHVNLREGNDAALGNGEKTKGLDRGFNAFQGKKSFKDLFTAEDKEEKGQWVEVKRRRPRRPARPRSPIIKHPCFSCGLGGHIRRFCPRKLKMRCYGCNSTNHLLRDCMVVQRPEVSKVELKSVYDITNRIRSLCKFAIFRPSCTVNATSLRTAMIKRHWEGKWQVKIYHLEKSSFLVEFENEIKRDYAVLAGKVSYEGFSGTFYEWNENWGAMRVFRPIIVWITLKGLPFQCWGEDEIKSIVGTFGKLHKIDDNLYSKRRVDAVKAMVEVEDISLVPRIIQCSYKAITDGKFRFYPVELYPSSACLPVSQWNDDTYQSYAEEGGSGGWEDERWSSARATVQQRGARREAEISEGEEGGQGGIGGENNDADFPPIITQAQVQARAEETGDQRARSNVRVDLVAEELERRRKGKGIYIPEVHGPRPMSPDRHVMPSGSDSCDPLNQDVARHDSPVPSASADADSRAGPCMKLGKTRDEPIDISEGSAQDFDMGGEQEVGGEPSAKICQEPREVKEEEHKGEEPRRCEGEAVEEVGEKSRLEGPVAIQQRAVSMQSDGSKGTTASIPPRFKKLQAQKAKQIAGTSSPFGKLQKGGFKFLKRSASSASSGPKTDPVPKKNRPLASLPDKEIVELASNVGVSKPLSDEQISRLRMAEKERAST